jgi:hypothetical protein
VFRNMQARSGKPDEARDGQKRARSAAAGEEKTMASILSVLLDSECWMNEEDAAELLVLSIVAEDDRKNGWTVR